MRKEPYSVGSIVHVIKRGARGLPITRDEDDKWRFLKILHFTNDSNRPENWERDLFEEGAGLHFKRPDKWLNQRKPLVRILSYCLKDNHFHLLLEEIKDGGISRFIQGLCGSMSLHFNKKYNEKGSLFQGAFKSKTVNSDYYLQLVNIYINVKNPFELYKGGLKEAIMNFDDAYKQAIEYDFCSLADYATNRNSPIIEKGIFSDISPKEYKRLAKEFLTEKLERINNIEELEEKGPIFDVE